MNKNELDDKYVLLEDISKKFLGWEPTFAKKKAVRGDVPFKIFQATSSRKSPWLVDVNDVEEYLKKQKKEKGRANG